MNILLSQDGGNHGLDSPILPATGDPGPPEFAAENLGTSCPRGRELDFVVFRLFLLVLVKVGGDMVPGLLCPTTRKEASIKGEQAVPNACDTLPFGKVPRRVGSFEKELCEGTVDSVAGHVE